MSGTNPLSVPSKVPFTKTVTTSQRGVGVTSAQVNDPAWLKFNQGMSSAVQQLITDDIANQTTVAGLVAAVAALETIVQISALMAGFIPPGPSWLLCDGSAISRTTNSVLFGIIGTTFGAGDGSTTFNIPLTGSPGGVTGLNFYMRVI